MIEALQYTFVQNAILAGVLVSIALGVIGTIVVVNKMVFIAGGIAHASYGGIGLALYFSLPFLLGAGIFSVFISIVMSFFYIKEVGRLDTIIGALWAFGMAVGIIFVDLSPGYNVDLMSYLFGSILSVPTQDLVLMLVLDLLIVGFVFFCYPIILSISYDKAYAKLQGININFFSVIKFVLIALCIVLSIRSVGLILVIALLTIPVYIVDSFSSNLAKTMFFSSILAFAFILAGLWLSYFFDLSSGACIILVACFCFLLNFLIRKMFVEK